MDPDVTLLFDAGARAGLGHSRRMEFLAEAMRSQGLGAVSRPLGSRTQPSKVTVIDSYALDADRSDFASQVVAAVDDLDRDLDVDVLIVPRPDARPAAALKANEVLSGFRHAIVDPRIGAGREFDPVEPTVLVCMGASDTKGLGSRIATTAATELPGTYVAHAPGPWSRTSSHPDVTTLARTTELNSQLANQPIVVCAGGVTMLESLAHSCPTIVVTTAQNQVAAASEVARTGSALLMRDGCTPEEIVTHLKALLGNQEQLVRLSERGRRLVDGQGANRIASALASLAGESNDRPGSGQRSDRRMFEIGLRPADTSDEHRLLRWRNEAQAVALSTTGEPVDSDTHARWFARSLGDPDREILIIELDEPVGMVRVDRRGDSGVVSIAVDASARGQGIATTALRLLTDRFRTHTRIASLEAEILAHNAASRAAFRSAGFTETADVGGIVHASASLHPLKASGEPECSDDGGPGDVG